MIDKDKLKRLKETLGNINKGHGENSVMILSDRKEIKTDAISTGSIGLDIALGIGGLPKGRIVEIYGLESSGKAQPLNCKILTPNGWTTMGELEIGSAIIAADGTQTSVDGIFPQGIQDVYEIKLSDGSKTKCTLDHLWTVQDNNSTSIDCFNTLSTKQLIEEGIVKNGGFKYRFKLPNIGKIEFYNKTEVLELDPYLLGLLLGDGGFSGGGVKYSTADLELIGSIKEILKKIPNTLIVKVTGTKYNYNFKKDYEGNDKNVISKKLQKLKLYGLKSNIKFIPGDYLFTSIENRIALLQGLLDTDGHIGSNGLSFSFTTVSKELADNFVFLCNSLSLRTSLKSRFTNYTHKGEVRSGQKAYTIFIQSDGSFIPFRLKRKIERFNSALKNQKSKHNRKHIVSIEKIGREECQCIFIGHKDSLYITDDFIPTHNTTLAIHVIAEAQKRGGICAFIDAEHAFDREYAQNLGVDVNNLVINQPDWGEQGLEIAEKLISSGTIDVCVIDSVAALTPKKEIDGEMGDVTMALQARMMSQAMRKLNATSHKNNVCLIFLNQIRSNIGCNSINNIVDWIKD